MAISMIKGSVKDNKVDQVVLKKKQAKATRKRKHKERVSGKLLDQMVEENC